MMMEYEAAGHGHEEHPPTTIKQYVLVGLVLTVLTAIELWLSYSGLPDGVLIGSLLAFSAVKFVIVVALFMHLSFDSRLLRRMFAFGLILAMAILLAFLALFRTDDSDIIGGIPEGAEGGAHGEPAATAEGGAAVTETPAATGTEAAGATETPAATEAATAASTDAPAATETPAATADAPAATPEAPAPTEAAPTATP